MTYRSFFFILMVLSCNIFCYAEGNIVILNGPPCAGKSTTATELQKLVPGSQIIRLDAVLKEAIIKLGIKFGLFTVDNLRGPDNKYGYNGLSHFIQYVCEHHTCTDEEFKELNDLRLKPFKEIVALAEKGITVIFDGVVAQSNDYLSECIDMLRGNNVIFILLYLPFEATAKRYAQSQRKKHGILHVFGYNYPWFYRIREKESEPVLEKLSYQKIISIIQNLDQSIPFILREQCIKEVVDRFELQENSQVELTPRMNYDLIINVQELSAENCAKIIVEHLHKDKSEISIFFENIMLPRPSIINTLKIVPKLSPKYLEFDSKL